MGTQPTCGVTQGYPRGAGRKEFQQGRQDAENWWAFVYKDKTPEIKGKSLEIIKN